MQKEKGSSIKHLQSQMKKQLNRLTQSKTKSECFSKSLSRNNLEMFDEQPQKTSIKSNSSRKFNTSITKSSKPFPLVRQSSLQARLSKHLPSCKNLASWKIDSNEKQLKKKKTKKDPSQRFLKLKRGDTLPQHPQHLSGLIASTTSLELNCDQSGRKERKSAEQYEKIIERQKRKVEELERIIETLMQC